MGFPIFETVKMFVMRYNKDAQQVFHSFKTGSKEAPYFQGASFLEINIDNDSL
ncbi:hypothetical protein [Bacillus pseudomycoides]|uniref:hypothetical protein n=1 Tax=Bacillus pseudomycoides TaxID=64104 RepID=UPI001482B8E0|nr:hypothetical protein [Bacillus pseudomycoides]